MTPLLYATESAQIPWDEFYQLRTVAKPLPTVRRLNLGRIHG